MHRLTDLLLVALTGCAAPIVALAAEPACHLPELANAPACTATCPAYCEQRAHADDRSCTSCGPAYCADPARGADAACYATCPGYCEDPAQGDQLACAGCSPPWCAEVEPSSALACTSGLGTESVGAAPPPLQDVSGAVRVHVADRPEAASPGIVQWGGAGGRSGGLVVEEPTPLSAAQCEDPRYRDHLDCAGRCPGYCSKIRYIDAGSCVSCQPAYCGLPLYLGAAPCGE